MENQESFDSPKISVLIEKKNLTDFYKNTLPNLLKVVFFRPIAGVRQVFSQPLENSYASTIMLMATTVLLYLIAPFLVVPSELREFFGSSLFLKSAVFAGLFIIAISVISYGIKSLSGKPVFKKELLTGALCGIGLILLLLVAFIAKFLVGDVDSFDLMNPVRLMDNTGFLVVFLIYIFHFMQNIVHQSLTASGTKEVISWYGSPATVLLALYIAFKIAL